MITKKEYYNKLLNGNFNRDFILSLFQDIGSSLEDSYFNDIEFSRNGIKFLNMEYDSFDDTYYTKDVEFSWDELIDEFFLQIGKGRK